VTGNAVKATIRYARRGERYVFNATDRAKSHMPYDEHEVDIGNIRYDTNDLSFDRNGFVLLRCATVATDLRDPARVVSEYLPEVEAITRELTGAEKVLTFGTMVRTDSKTEFDGNKVAQFAHVDYGRRSVRDLTIDLVGEQEASYWLERRHMLINFWRPIATVARMPLALADASTIKAEDLLDIEVYGSLGDPNRRKLYGFNLAYHPEQRWLYAPAMRPDEMWAFKLFDTDSSKTQLTAHTAFVDPGSRHDAPPRESIEVRTISFMP
jgi:hypothetical protein